MTEIPFDESELDRQPVYLDRSTLERYATCPFQGWAVETGECLAGSPEADSGQEVHAVIAGAIDDYARDGAPPRDYMEQEIVKVRPDVQADALMALRPSIWSICDFLTSRNPADIIRYQGGQGDRSGQLAWELLPASGDRPAIMPTSEIDLLLAGASEYELEEIDFKTGHTVWSATEVRATFQFRMHAWLVFRNYPALESLRVSAWMTRLKSRTPAVTFRPKDADDFEGVLLQAVEYRRKATFRDGAEMWPGYDKCLLCPAVFLCPKAATGQAFRLNSDPLGFAQETSVMEIELQKRKADLRKYVDEHGEIVGKGVAFGLNAPKTVRKPGANSYTFYSPPENGNGEDLKDGLEKAFKGKTA